MRRKFRGVEYTIEVKNPRGVCKGVKSLVVDGRKVPGNLIPAPAAGCRAVKVEVTLGAWPSPGAGGNANLPAGFDRMIVNLAWLLVVLTLGLLSPGPDFMLIVKNSVGTPRSFALGTVAGIAAGLAVQVLVISFGFVAAPPPVLRAVQIAGAGFLAYLGLRALFAAPGPAGAPAAALRAGARSGFLQGLLCISPIRRRSFSLSACSPRRSGRTRACPGGSPCRSPW